MSYSELTRAVNSKLQTGGEALDKQIDTWFNRGIVKSVQRGTKNFDSENVTVTVKISQINPEKAFIILNGDSDYTKRDSGYVYSPFLESVTATSFSVRTAYTVIGTKFSWQVIEFY